MASSYQGKDGLYVHAVVNVADLNAVRGLWLALDIAPQNGGQTKTLYLRIDDVSVEYFVMFVACDQLPPLGGSSPLMWPEFQCWTSSASPWIPARASP